MSTDYRIVFIDIDGTLLRSDHTVSSRTIAAVGQARALGIQVMLVSARPFHGMVEIARQVGLESQPMAGLNGAQIMQGETLLFESVIPPPLACEISQNLEIHPDATPIFYAPWQWYALSHNEAVTQEQRITEVPVSITTVPALQAAWTRSGKGPNKILVIAPTELTQSLQDKLYQAYSAHLNLSTSKPTFLEVMDRTASKKQAVVFMLKHFGLERQQAICIGDNYNDQEMLSFAGLGVAMGNAPDAVKASAGWVTTTNNEDGVALALTHLLGLR